MKISTLFGLFALLFVIQLVSQFASASPVDLQLSLSQMQSCPCSSTNQLVSVANKGLVSDTYRLSSDSPWTTFAGCDVGAISNNELVLGAGETAKCSVFITPACTANVGDSTITISARSLSTGEQSSKQLKFGVLACHGVEISVSDTSGCENEKTIIPTTVKNTGRYAETFLMNSSVSGKFDFKEFTLGPGETGFVQFETTAKSQNINFVVQSKDSSAYAAKRITLNAVKCYSFYTELIPKESLTCLRKTATFDLKIKNSGTKTDIYQIKTEPVSLLGENKTVLNASGEKTIQITALPKSVGKFVLNVNVTSVAKEITQELKATMDVKECGAISLTTEKISQSACGNEKVVFPITLKNIGAVKELYELSANIGVLDVIKVLLGSGESETVNLEVNTTGMQPKIYNILVNATAGAFSEKLNLNLTVDSCYKSELAITPSAVSMCPGKIANYTATLTNKGKYADTFDVIAAGKEIAKSILLQPNENKSFSFSVDYKDVSGVYRIDANSTSPNSKAGAQAALVLRDLNSCYGASLTANETQKRILPSNSTLYEITIKNTGIEAMSYVLNSTGPQWSRLGLDSIALKPNETGKLYFYVSPPADAQIKKYASNVFAFSEKGAKSSLEIVTEVVSKIPVVTTTIMNITTTTRLNITKPIDVPVVSRTMLVIGIILAIAVILLLRHVILKK